MNPQETEQVIARDELWVPTAERVNISTTNVRLETTVKQKEETFQVVIDVTINSTCSSRHSLLLMSLKFLLQPFWLQSPSIKDSGLMDLFLPKKFNIHNIQICLWTTCISLGGLWQLASTNVYLERHLAMTTYGLAIPVTMLNYDIIQSESYEDVHHVLYGQIPLRRAEGRFTREETQGHIPTEESVDVFDESEPEPLIRRKTSRRRVVKKKATISVDDNIIPEPASLVLGKSYRIAEAVEDAVERDENVRETASDEGTGKIPGVLDESIFADAEDDNEETKYDSDNIYKYRINVRKNAVIEMKDAERTTDITKETTEQPLTSSSVSVPSDYGNQFLNLSHNEEIFKQPPVLQQTTPNPTTIPTPPINT
ncbi:hypothetical protein Tco_1120287, partial [Tanacetum coccineum]